MKQDSFPIDEVDAQTLFMVIRELHERKNFGVLIAAKQHISELLKGEDTWNLSDASGERSNS
jgi:hypothetical protein